MKKRIVLFIFIGIMMLLLFGCNRSPEEVESAGDNYATDGYLSTMDNSKTGKNSADQSGKLKKTETAINVEEEKENAGPPIKLNIEEADYVMVGFMSGSNDLFTDDYETVKNLAGQFNGIILEKTEKTFNLRSALEFDFYYNDRNVASFLVDKNGVFMIDGNYYMISSDSFDYGAINHFLETEHAIKIVPPIELNIEEADFVRVGYVLSSNNLFTDDYETVKNLAGHFSGLILKRTGKMTSLLTMLGFSFYNKDKEVASFYVDEYGVFMIDGKYYTISSGSFDFEAVKRIYEGALKKE